MAHAAGACSVVVPGATGRRACVRRTGAGAAPATGSPALAFVSSRTLSPNLCTLFFDPLPPIPPSRWLICLWRRAADIFMKNAGYQALIGQAFFGGAPLEHFKVGGR